MARTLPAGRTLAAALFLAVPAVPATAQTAPPSPAEVLGYAVGERFTPYAGVREYVRALDDASDRVEARVYGRTAEGRELLQVVIARPENLRRLPEILAANDELTRPGTSPERVRQIAATNPAVVYFSYGVHGNEASSSEAAMWTAWDLARDAAEVRGVLDSLVVVIDPAANPDGRDRYVGWFQGVVGERPNPNPQAREHREPWPGGRFNHYLFDLNRDWAWGTQPETRARLATWGQWNPQVHVDFHEMFYNSTYFFFPAAEPINPIYPDYVLDWGRRFGAANARAFDAQGVAYYTGEAFDLFYPGYGDSWPALTGAIGMTYEQAGHGAAGLAIRQETGDTLTLRERATNHRTTGQATLRTAAAGKSRLLTDFATGARTAGEGEADFFLVPGADRSRVEELVAHLRRQGIEVERAGRAFSAGSRAYPGMEVRSSFPAGTYRVRARQPRGRLAVTLLQPTTELRAEYSYDVSAWSLPYAYGVQAVRVGAGAAGGAGWEPVRALSGAPAGGTPPAAGYGYLVEPGEESTGGVVALLRDGARVRVLARPATLAGRRWPAGTWFIPAAGNDSLVARIARAGLGGRVTATATGRAEEGIDLGSENVVGVRLPRVAVVSGDGVSATSFGGHWFYLEQVLKLPFDAVRTEDLAAMDWSLYDVVVLPEASGRALSQGAREALKTWVQGGGRLVAVGSGAAAVAETFEVRTREGTSADTSRAALLAGREERQRQDWRQEVPGAILPLTLDEAHPLAWGAGMDGTPGSTFALHQGTLVFEPSPSTETVAHFARGVRLLSGVMAPDQVRRLEEGSWLVTRRVGSGSVVLFANDPLFRLFWRSTQPLYANALLLQRVP